MKHLKPFIGIGIFFLVVYLVWQLAPPFFHNYQFQSDVDDAAKQATYSAKTEDDVRADVFKQAQSDSIPITQDQIQVTKTGTSCSIGVAYTVHVELPVLPQDFHFNVTSQNKNIAY